MKPPLLAAITGGSGSGKSWLAGKLTQALGAEATMLSLDDFYLDRSHLPDERRARLNFDHPRAIDWAAFENTLRCVRSGHTASIPCYDFATHCRLRKAKRLRLRPIIIVEGLWLLRRPAIRRLFAFSIFLKSSAATRLRRRLDRDCRTRGRTEASVKKQFWTHVQPMHSRYVEPQAKNADVIISDKTSSGDIARLASRLRQIRAEIET